jgi:hypothetical protein
MSYLCEPEFFSFVSTNPYVQKQIQCGAWNVAFADVSDITPDIKYLFKSPDNNNNVHSSIRNIGCLQQRYSTFFVRVPPDIISLELCTPKFVDT